MANFSVEWLSKSHYESPTDTKEMKGSTVPGQEHSPTSPNNSCGYASGPDSDVGEDSEGEAVQQRRVRTKFTSEQITKLEDTFSKYKYLGATKRRKMAEKLKLSETQVKTWFQNRRMKLKREVQDLCPDFNLCVPAALLPPLLFQHPSLSGQFPGLYPQLHPRHSASLPVALHQEHRSHPLLIPSQFYCTVTPLPSDRREKKLF